MRFYTIHILKRASSDVVVPSRWNKKIIQKLSSNRFLSSLGPAKSGRLKGKEGFLITKPGEAYLAELQTASKEARRFWIPIISNILSVIIGFILGKLFP